MIMVKNPWWMLNSALLLLLLVLLAIILFIRPTVPVSASLKPIVGATLEVATARRIDLSQIYRNDLFGTHVEAQMIEEKKEQKPEVVVPLPPPPQPAALVQQQMPQFLPPLAVSVKGIMYSSHELDNRAIIADAKSHRESLYRLGDKILDAEIIYIGNNKVMFIRSNGQQETIFVTPQDAQHDPLYRQRKPGEMVARRISDNDYILYTDLFKQRLPTMAQFLDSFDITTAWEQGKILGVRIGKLGVDSIAASLGLQQADIVTAINGISLVNTENRTRVFHALAQAGSGTAVNVTVLRAGQPITYRYTLQEKEAESDEEMGPLPRTFIPREVAEVVPAPQAPEQPQLPTAGSAYFAIDEPPAEQPPSEQPSAEQRVTEQPAAVPQPLAENLVESQDQQKLLSIGNPLELIQKRDRESMMAFGGRNAMLEPAQP